MSVTALSHQATQVVTGADIMWALAKAALIIGVSAIALYFAMLIAFYVFIGVLHLSGLAIRWACYALFARLSLVFRGPTQQSTAKVMQPKSPAMTLLPDIPERPRGYLLH